jgi:NAD(P)-dependent dehydrogenase (short-subunit alcohol dehydrogenase family)
MARSDKKVFPVLEGNVAIVTGAAMGMGEATARLFAEAGAKYELAQMVAQGGGGSIINISSVSGFRPQLNTIVYVAAKHGVNGLTKNAAMEYGRFDIRVNAVAPGAIDTPMLKASLDEMKLDRKEFAKQLSVLERFGQPDEVAQGSLWLASDASSFVTGTVLHIDGGYTGAM